MEGSSQSDQPVLVADVEVTAVRPGRTEFVLQGRGTDRSEYRLEMHLDVPVDQKTSVVLGELFAQSEWRVWRSVRSPIAAPNPRTRGVKTGA